MDKKYNISWRRENKPEHIWDNLKDANIALTQIMDNMSNENDTIYVSIVATEGDIEKEADVFETDRFSIEGEPLMERDMLMKEYKYDGTNHIVNGVTFTEEDYKVYMSLLGLCENYDVFNKDANKKKDKIEKIAVRLNHTEKYINSIIEDLAITDEDLLRHLQMITLDVRDLREYLLYDLKRRKQIERLRELDGTTLNSKQFAMEFMASLSKENDDEES